MSATTRFFWILPAVLVTSWLAVHSLAALPVNGLEDPPLAATSARIADPTLAQMISHFAQQPRVRRD